MHCFSLVIKHRLVLLAVTLWVALTPIGMADA